VDQNGRPWGPGRPGCRAGALPLRLLALPRYFRNFFLSALIACLGVTSVTAGSASGDPIDDKRAQAAALEEQLTTTNQELSALGERYNGARLRLQEAEANLAAVQAQIETTEAEVARIKGLVDQNAASVYRRARAGASLDGYDFEDAKDLVRRTHYAETQAERDDRLLRELDQVKEQLSDERDDADAARAEADAERRKIEETKAALEAAQAQQQQLLAQVQGEIATLVQQELERRQAEALAQASAKLQGGDGDPNLPPPGPAAAQAIEFAKAQIGKTYVYAAAGPDHYDCSGLTMAAFASAGVQLPHYSGAQYAALPHVPLTHLMPGDLLFWGANASSHVAIYLGDLKIIESGGTGHDVHIGPIWGHPMGAARVLQ
jgi:peptidoglycan DL-endopeptidase CwlO